VVRIGRSLALVRHEGLKQLSTLCAIQTMIGAEAGCLSVPASRDSVAELFKALDISPPQTLLRRKGKADTKRKLQPRRK